MLRITQKKINDFPRKGGGGGSIVILDEAGSTGIFMEGEELGITLFTIVMIMDEDGVQVIDMDRYRLI